MIKEIAKFIDIRTSFALGSTMFINNFIKSSPDECIVLLNTTGGPIDYQKTDYSQPVISIITRSNSYDNALNYANEIRDLFKANCGIDLPIIEGATALILASSHPVGEPIYIGEDEKGRHQYSINIKLDITNKT